MRYSKCPQASECTPHDFVLVSDSRHQEEAGAQKNSCFSDNGLSTNAFYLVLIYRLYTFVVWASFSMCVHFNKMFVKIYVIELEGVMG